MMEDVKPEEKSPLLLYMVEGDGNVSKNNKRVNFDKGRLYGISSGATAVFTEFPNYVSPCWITTLLSSLIFLMMVLLMVSSMGPSSGLRVPRCVPNHSEDLDNKTIHLVHQEGGWNQDQIELLEKIRNEYVGYDVHLVLLRPYPEKHNEITKSPSSERSLQSRNDSNEADSTAQSMPPMNQAVIEIKRAKRAKKNMRGLKRKKREHVDKIGPMGIGFGVKSLLDILLRSRVENGAIIKRNPNETKLLPTLFNFTEPVLLPITTTTESQPKTLDDVICDFPGLSVRNITLEEAFAKTPLAYTWQKLNPDLIIFAVRVLHLWQYGGLSFKIDERVRHEAEGVDNFSITPFQTTEPNPFEILPILPYPTNDKLLNFILEGRKKYETLPKEVVTADDEGLHIFTKTPCHVFFGEVIMNLKKARGDEKPKSIIQKSLRVFCKHAAVGNNYCHNLVRKYSDV